MIAALRRLAARGWDLVPVTPLGAVALLLVLVARDWAKRNADVVLMALCYAALGLIAAATLMVVFSALVTFLLQKRLPFMELSLEAGTPVRLPFALPPARWIPWVAVRIGWVGMAGMHVDVVTRDGLLVEEVVAEGRASLSSLVRTVTLDSVFGVARLRLTFASRCAIRVLPAKGLARPAELFHVAGADDPVADPAGALAGDLVEIRKYAPGDSLKLVLWKAFGKTGKLLVRTPERASPPRARYLVYFVPGEGDEPSAGLARAFLEWLPESEELVFGADDGSATAGHREPALEKVVRSVLCRAEGGARLADFVAEGERGGFPKLLLFVPHKPGAWCRRVTSAVEKFRGAVQAFIGVDGIEGEGVAAPPGARGVATPPARRGDLENVQSALQAAGIASFVVDRQLGALAAAPRRRA